MAPRIIWHYTVGQWLSKIIQDGIIKPATAYVPQGEKPIVWFSMNQEWELTANKSWMDSPGIVIHLDRAQTAELCGGLARIGVASGTAPHDWKSLRELSGMDSKMAQGLYREAIERGARPGEWRGTFDPVPRKKWIAVEVFRENQWRSIPVEEWADAPHTEANEC